MVKEFIGILRRIIKVRILFYYLLLFIFLAFFPIRIIPDYLLLEKITARKEMLFRLLTTIIGFSGLILTILLVAYNFFIKTIRRNTLEFITDNNWLKIIFSCFFGNVLFLCLSFFSVETYTYVNDISILYCSYFITFIFILSLFPLAILSFNDSVSLKKIDGLIQLIKEENINELYHTDVNDNWHLKIEKNSILMLRDIATNAIVDKDWILPQTILNKLFGILIAPINSNTSRVSIEANTYVWFLFANHIKREVIKQNDFVTGRSLLFSNLFIHEHFAENKVINANYSEIDSFLNDYFQLIVQNNLFVELQPYFLKYTTDIVKAHFSIIQYSDTDLPTKRYRSTQEEFINFEPTEVTNYWFYLNYQLPDLVFKMLESAIENKRKVIYDYFSLSINSMLDSIYISNNHLTEFQKEEAITEMLWKAGEISNYAINNSIYKGIDIVSENQIVLWFEKNTAIGYQSLYQFSRMIKRLNEKNELSEYYIDKFFMIIRQIISAKVEKTTIVNIVENVLDTTIKFLNNIDTSLKVKKCFLYQLNWYRNSFLDTNNILLSSKEKYNDILNSFLDGYDYHSFLE